MTEVQVVIEQIVQFRDARGYICQKEWDGTKGAGDAASRVGIDAYLTSILGFPHAPLFNYLLDGIEVEPGIYKRHPTSDISFNTIKDFSRDQQIPLVIAMGAYPEQKPRLMRLFLKHILRFGKYQNWDFMGTQHLGMYLRSFNWKLLYPLLPILDLGLVIDSISNVVRYKLDPDDTTNHLNHSLAIIQAYYVQPTPISYIARKIYSWAHPQAGLDSYFRAETGAPPMHLLYKPITNKIDL